MSLISSLKHFENLNFRINYSLLNEIHADFNTTEGYKRNVNIVGEETDETLPVRDQ